MVFESFIDEFSRNRFVYYWTWWCFKIRTAVVYFLCHDSGFGQIWSFSINLLRKVYFKYVPSQKRFKDRESEFSKIVWPPVMLLTDLMYLYKQIVTWRNVHDITWRYSRFREIFFKSFIIFHTSLFLLAIAVIITLTK